MIHMWITCQMHTLRTIKVGIVLVEENNELIEEIDCFGKLKVDGD